MPESKNSSGIHRCVLKVLGVDLKGRRGLAHTHERRPTREGSGHRRGKREPPSEPATSPAEAREWIEKGLVRLNTLESELGRLKEGCLELEAEAVAWSSLESERGHRIATLERERYRIERLEGELEFRRLPWYRRWFGT